MDAIKLLRAKLFHDVNVTISPPEEKALARFFLNAALTMLEKTPKCLIY